uniref:Fork-head domain-containing protein n=1 Tax=Anopheles maculatus TaxID=74869 RepID=A0A182ST16_9DIPT
MDTDTDVSPQESTSNAMQAHSSSTLFTNAGNEDGSDSVIPPDAVNFIARLVGVNHLLLISEPTAVVGRASPRSIVDLPVSENKLISRRHFIIQYCNNEFSVVCLSKNGVYMGDEFLPKSDTPYKLQTSCQFRFPSTDIRVFFDNLIGPTPNVGLVVDKHMFLSILLYDVPVAAQDEATVCNNNNEYQENNSECHTNNPNVQNTFSKLLTTAPASIPSNEQVGAEFEAENAPEEITTSALPTADPVISDKGKQPSSKPSLRDRGKPPFSYCQLIVQAIRASPSQQLALAEIYAYLKEKYPYFRDHPGKGWQNSIRHNLSLNRFFVKIPRTNEVMGKGNYWQIDNVIYNKMMASRYQKPNRRSATITYLGGGNGGNCKSAPASPHHDNDLCPAPSMGKQMSMSVPGSPEHSLDDCL